LKMQNLMLILNPFNKLQKNLYKKGINKKATEKRIFYFYYCVQKPITFFGALFVFFSTDLNSASNFALYDPHIDLFLRIFYRLY
jgi:hypothetical protein